MARLVNEAPLVRLIGVRGGCSLGTGIITGLRLFGPTNDIGSEITETVIRSTRGDNGLGGNSAVVRPASNGANVNLTSMTATGNCGAVLAVPRAVDIREEGLLGTCNTRVILASNAGNVDNTVTGTGRLRGRVSNNVVLNRFRGPTGPGTRFSAANPRV